MTAKKKRTKKPVLPKVGDVVRFTLVYSKEVGEITEYRGAIGIDGAHLFGIRFPLVPTYEGEEHYTDFPVERLNVIKKAA